MINIIHEILKFVFDFILLGVVLKIIVGHWLAEKIMEWSKKFFQDAERNERVRALWSHFYLQAQDSGHNTNVVECTEGSCNLI
jgi:hypothetical protein